MLLQGKISPLLIIFPFMGKGEQVKVPSKSEFLVNIDYVQTNAEFIQMILLSCISHPFH